MDFSQTNNLLKQSRNILLISNPNPNPDVVSGALALSYFFKNIGKKSDIVIDKFVPHPSLHFLPEINTIKTNLKNLKKLILSVDLSKTKMNDLNYEVKDDKLHIFLTPKQGWWDKQDIVAQPSTYHYDLTLTLGAKSVETLGTPFEKNTDFFYKVPIVNIDYDLNNEQFGQINLVDITATSVCEIIYRFLKSYEVEMDENLSTYLLTGILASTNCFKSKKITPQILQMAGELIDTGAKREEIIANLYRKHTIKSLQLWGRALSRLKLDSQFGMVWTTLTKNDFLETGADERYLSEVIDELILNSPETKIAILIYEQMQGGICCVIKTQKNINASKLIKNYEGETGENVFRFYLTNKNPLDAEREVVEEVRGNLRDVV